MCEFTSIPCLSPLVGKAVWVHGGGVGLLGTQTECEALRHERSERDTVQPSERLDVSPSRRPYYKRPYYWLAP